MQILYIIGNGFDLNLGLETSFKDFNQHYIKIESNNKNVKLLKEAISKNIVDWSDLELALGEHTKKLQNIEELDDILLDIGEELSLYLKREENKLEKYEFNQQKFFKHLSYPEKFFLPTDKDKLTQRKLKWSKHHWTINIYTFNYTTVIEKILGGNQKNILLANRPDNTKIKLGEIKHIHGYLENEMVMGVNDKSQISNKSFHDNQDILESIVKSECNQANKNNINIEFARKINSANLICIFGSSIGDTDKKWWELIGERLMGDCYMMVFSEGSEISPRTLHMQTREERVIRNNFLNKTNLSDTDKKVIENKIFIAYNSGMFDGISDLGEKES